MDHTARRLLAEVEAQDPTAFRCEDAGELRSWQQHEKQLAFNVAYGEWREANEDFNARGLDEMREELAYLRKHAQHPRGVGYAVFMRRQGTPLP